MGSLPQVFPPTQPKGIISTEFSDQLTGISHKNFYAYVTRDNSGLVYKMSPNIVPSKSENTTTTYKAHVEAYTSGSGSTTLTIPQFESPPMVQSALLDGEFEAVFGVTSSANGGATITYGFTVTVSKYDGTTETQLGTITTGTVTTLAATSINDIVTVPITLTKTKLNVGDTLRVDVVGNFDSSTGTQDYVIGHDPLDRDGIFLTPSSNSFEQTQMIFKFPFRVFE